MNHDLRVRFNGEGAHLDITTFCAGDAAWVGDFRHTGAAAFHGDQIKTGSLRADGRVYQFQHVLGYDW